MNRTVAPRQLILTAAQAHALRDGSLDVGLARVSGLHHRMTIRPASRVPSEPQASGGLLGRLRGAGSARIDGRRAIKLVPLHGCGEYNVWGRRGSVR